MHAFPGIKEGVIYRRGSGSNSPVDVMRELISSGGCFSAAQGALQHSALPTQASNEARRIWCLGGWGGAPIWYVGRARYSGPLVRLAPALWMDREANKRFPSLVAVAMKAGLARSGS